MPRRNTQTGARSESLTEHPLVQKLAQAGGGNVPEPSVVLYGYLGHGTEEGTWRVYLSPAFDDYVEVGEDAILAIEELPANAGNRLWVRRGTELVRRHTVSRKVRAGFLRGNIADRAAAGTYSTAAAARYVLPQPTYVQTHCPSCWAPCSTGPTCPQYSESVTCSDFFGCNPDPWPPPPPPDM